MITQNQVRDLIGRHARRLDRHEGRQDRSDLPRRPDRAARVGDGEHRHVRPQRELRAARRGADAPATSCGSPTPRTRSRTPRTSTSDGGHLDQSEEASSTATTAWTTREPRSDCGLPDAAPAATPHRAPSRGAGHDTSGAEHRRRHDALGGAGAGRHRDGDRRQGSAAQVGRDRGAATSRSRSPRRRRGSRPSRSPTPTGASALDGAGHHRGGARGHPHRGAPRRRQGDRAGRAGQAHQGHRDSPRRRCPRQVRKERIGADGDVDLPRRPRTQFTLTTAIRPRTKEGTAWRSTRTRSWNCCDRRARTTRRAGRQGASGPGATRRSTPGSSPSCGVNPQD